MNKVVAVPMLVLLAAWNASAAAPGIDPDGLVVTPPSAPPPPLVHGFNADLLDGHDARAFALASHAHDAQYLPLGGKAANADRLDGLDSAQLLRAESVAVCVAKDEAFPVRAGENARPWRAEECDRGLRAGCVGMLGRARSVAGSDAFEALGPGEADATGRALAQGGASWRAPADGAGVWLRVTYLCR